MAGQGYTGLAIDQPAGSSRTNPYAAESWLEPWLTKHSEFYRKHLTRDGRLESKSTRRNSIATEVLESRKNSVAGSEAEAGAINATPAPAEERRESANSESSGEEPASKKHKGHFGWRKSVSWVPHP